MSDEAVYAVINAASSQLKKTKKESATATLLPVLAMLAWSAYVSGFLVLLSLVPATLLAATAFVLVQKTDVFSNRVAEEVTNTEEENAGNQQRQQVESIRYRDSNERFRGISDAFSSLSEMFYNLSDRFRHILKPLSGHRHMHSNRQPHLQEVPSTH